MPQRAWNALGAATRATPLSGCCCSRRGDGGRRNPPPHRLLFAQDQGRDKGEGGNPLPYLLPRLCVPNEKERGGKPPSILLPRPCASDEEERGGKPPHVCWPHPCAWPSLSKERVRCPAAHTPPRGGRERGYASAVVQDAGCILQCCSSGEGRALAVLTHGCKRSNMRGMHWGLQCARSPLGGSGGYRTMTWWRGKSPPLYLLHFEACRPFVAGRAPCQGRGEEDEEEGKGGALPVLAADEEEEGESVFAPWRRLPAKEDERNPPWWT